MQLPQNRRFLLLFGLVATTAVVVWMLLASTTDESLTFMRNHSTRNSRRLLSMSRGLNQFSDPKTVKIRGFYEDNPSSAQVDTRQVHLGFGDSEVEPFYAPAPEYEYNDDGNAAYYSDETLEPEISLAERSNCQIVYILGVEGSIHHGFTPVIEKLAAIQTDEYDTPYEVSYPNGWLRSAIFGHHNTLRQLNDPELVKSRMRKICPRDGKKRIIIEDASFPSGLSDDPRSYRVYRQEWWGQATMEEIANSETALNHPTNLHVFYETYSAYADIKFIVLHRSFIETIASHFEFDETVQRHTNVISGFMLLIRRFLDSHPTDTMTGQRLWTLVCLEHIMGKTFGGDQEQLRVSRQHVIRSLVDFLGWSTVECPGCFYHWTGTRKKHKEILGNENVAMLYEHMEKMKGVWPPPSEQQCSL